MEHQHPWHSAPLDFKDETVNAIIEIPKGGRAKFELDKKSGLLKLDRVLYSAVYYPANYGFIPQSFGEDGDPLDILVLSQIEITPLCLVNTRILGVLRMLDQGDPDDKLIAAATGDPGVKHYRSIEELPEHFFSEMRSFFEDYKKLENKEVTVDEFQGREKAVQILRESIKRYDDEIRPKL